MPRRIKSMKKVQNDKEEKAQTTSTSVEPTSAEKPVEETKSPAEQIQETATPTGNNPSATKNGNPDYTMDDVVSVAETGSLPPVEPKSAYDMYMEEAKNIFNQSVEANKKIAESQSASAGAQYRELNRNINELNKANGKINTGYAGDTSIDAFNSYRNSVNKSYSDANSANNELYSYYLGEITRIQQAKDSQDATKRQLNIQEQQARQQESAIVLSGISNIVNKDDAYNKNGTISSGSAKQLWNYVSTYYGGEEKIPNDVKATLNSTKGFSEWLNEYNKNANTPSYNNKNSSTGSAFRLRKIDEGGNIGDVGVADFAVVKSSFNKELSSPVEDKRNNNFTISYFGKPYNLETGKQSEEPSADVVAQLNKYIRGAYSRDPQQGDIAYYDGKFYVLCEDGKTYRSINDTRDFEEFASAFKKKVGIEEEND